MAVRRVAGALPADGAISTIAATGWHGDSGDGGPAKEARVNMPQSLDQDAAGNLYIADEHNHRVRVIGADGRVRTLVGDGTPGFAGDGGGAALARLNDPEAVMVRSDGSILVSDGDNRRVRSIARNLRISTFAGRGK